MVVCDHDVEAERSGTYDLGDGGDPAVDGQHEAAAVFCQPVERLAGDAVALLEAARQVPRDVGPELAENEYRERRGADPVGVVVAMDADALF
jgi:hypothetical protein